MSRSRLMTLALAVGLLGASQLQAQQPHNPNAMAGGMMATHGDSMQGRAAEQRLMHLVDAMNAAPPSRRMAAVVEVINELAAQNREMQAHMAGMMHGAQMMGMMQPAESGGPCRMGDARVRPTPSKPAPDSAKHEPKH